MRPAGTTRTSAYSQPVIGKHPSERIDCPLPSLTRGPALYKPVSSESQACQVNAHETKSVRLAIAQTEVSFTDEFLNHLLKRNIVASVTSPERILRTLEASPREYDIVAYPIYTQSQRASEFMRHIRHWRESNGGIPYPKAWIISFQDQLPNTVVWLLRSGATRYLRFGTEDDLIEDLRAEHDKQMSSFHPFHHLHLRFVHCGNQKGIGCISGERLEAIYASFRPGIEHQVEQSESVLRFANLLAMHRWRAWTPAQIIQLMNRNPFYICAGPKTNLLGRSSVKTYIMRYEDALLDIWHKQNRGFAPPHMVQREARGGREIAYRLLGVAEINHI